MFLVQLVSFLMLLVCIVAFGGTLIAAGLGLLPVFDTAVFAGAAVFLGWRFSTHIE